jgi:hypothetical protein
MDHVVEVAVLDAQLAQPLQVLERLRVDIVAHFRHVGPAFESLGDEKRVA